MARRTEMEVFGIAFVDLMCLAFVGQMILWINQPKPAEKTHLDATLVTVEQYGNAHFHKQGRVVIRPAPASGLSIPPALAVVPPAPTAGHPTLSSPDPGLSAGELADLPLGVTSSRERSLGDDAKLRMSYTLGAHSGVAGTVSLCFDGLSGQTYQVWIPFHRDECNDSGQIHAVRVRSVTAGGEIWTGGFIHNASLNTAEFRNDWHQLGIFLGSDPNNRGKTWDEIIDKRLLVFKPATSPPPETVLWLCVEVSGGGIQKFLLQQTDPWSAAAPPRATMALTAAGMEKTKEQLVTHRVGDPLNSP